MGTILLIILILFSGGALPTWFYSANWGYGRQRWIRRGPVSLGHSGVDWSDVTGVEKALSASRPTKFCCVHVIFATG